MLCPNCHAYVPSDAVRCPRCGMPVNLPDDGEKQEDSDLLSFRQGRHLAAHQQAAQKRLPCHGGGHARRAPGSSPA